VAYNHQFHKIAKSERFSPLRIFFSDFEFISVLAGYRVDLTGRVREASRF